MTIQKDGVDIVPSTIDLAGAEVELTGKGYKFMVNLLGVTVSG